MSFRNIRLENTFVLTATPFDVFAFGTHSRKNVRIIASIESALGVMNLKEIATSDPRVDALVV